jgi:hypothetical protein
MPAKPEVQHDREMAAQPSHPSGVAPPGKTAGPGLRCMLKEKVKHTASSTTTFGAKVD